MAIQGKVLRRTIILLLIVWVLLLLVLYLTSGKFRDHGIEMLRNQLKKNLRTEIQIRKNDIHFSLLKNFPNAAIQLENIYVKSAEGPDYSEFQYTAKDTLLFAGRVDLVLDLWSLLTRKYVLKRINIEDGQINLLSDSHLAVNYDVWSAGSLNDSIENQIEYDIRKIELRNMKLNYLDTKVKVHYSGMVDRVDASGSFKNEDFQFKTRIVATDNALIYEKWRFRHQKTMPSQLTIIKEGAVYTIKDGTVTLYGLPVQVKGSYHTTNRSYTLNCNMDRIAIQRLDNSFITLYAPDYKFFPLKGELTCNADIIGSSRERNKMDVLFRLDQAVLLNKEMEIKLTDLNTSGSYTNGRYRNNASGSIRIDTLHCISGKSKLALSGSIVNLDAPQILGYISGTVELKKLMILKSIGNQFILDGLAHADFRINGKLRSVKKLGSRDLKAVSLRGKVDLENAYIEKRDKTLPEVTVNGGIKLKNLMEIDLEGLDITTGQSNLRVNGSVDNLPQFSSDKTIFPIFRGTIRSREFHVEDFLIGDKEDKKEAMRIELPDSVYLSGDFVLDKFYFDNFYATHVTGDFQYKPKKLLLNGFNMYSQGGRIESYQLIEQRNNRIYTKTKAEFNNLDISDLFFAVNEFSLEVITHNNIDGTLTGYANIDATWDLGLNPIYDEIVGHSVISIEKGELKDYQPMMGLSRFIAIDELKHIKFDRMQMDIHIRDRNLNIAQTHIKSSIFAISGSGNHGFDNSYTYKIQLQLADVLWRKAKNRKPQNTEFGYVIDDGLGRTTIPLMISGRDTLYTVSYDRKTAGTNFIDKLKKERDGWKNFRKKDTHEEEEIEGDIRIQWEEENPQEKEVIRKKPVENGNDEDEFIIDWESD